MQTRSSQDRWSGSEATLATVRLWINELKFLLALARLRNLTLRAGFDPLQPRVPSGSPDGGEWVGSGGGTTQGVTPSSAATDSPSRPLRTVQADPLRYTVNLAAEEIRGGHTIARHVGKTDAELMARMYPSLQFGILELIPQRFGSFDSLSSANNFVNRTLERDRALVDLVASGASTEEFLEARFGYRTGREAFRPVGNPDAYMRSTDSVGVLIRHDPMRETRYWIVTAYPFNALPR